MAKGSNKIECFKITFNLNDLIDGELRIFRGMAFQIVEQRN